MTLIIAVLVSLAVGIVFGVFGRAMVEKETGPSREEVADWAQRLEIIMVADAKVAKEKLTAIVKELRKKL
jgi:hypothetical protein